ncbi:MAG: response regulator [Mariprofundales bacterium]
MSKSTNTQILLLEKMRFFLKHAGMAVPVAMLASILLLFVLWEHQPKYELFIWLGMIVAITLTMKMIFKRYQASQIPPEELDKYVFWFASGSLLISVFWSIGAMWFLAVSPFDMQIFIYLVLIGLAAGAAGTFYSLRSVCYTTITALMMPPTILLLILGERLYFGMGIMFILFFMLLIGISRNANAQLQTNILLNIDKQGLIKTLETNKLLFADGNNEEVNQRLLARENMYHKMVDGALDAMLIHDDGHILFANPAAVNLFGLTEMNQLLGMNIRQLVRNDVMDSIRSRVKNSLHKKINGDASSTDDATHEVYSSSIFAEERLRCFDGSPFVAEVGAVPIIFDGQKAMHMVMRDVSGRKATETALCKALEGEQAASAIKNAFLANMSHEIRTPLGGVIGMAEVLADTQLDDEQKEAADIIHSSSRALLAVIDDILDFSRIEAGKMRYDSLPFELRNCIREAMRPLSVRSAAKKLELIVYVDPRTPESFIGDAYRLRQILGNLVSNAIKFTERGEIAVTMRVVRTEKNHRYVLRCSVRDTGIGILAEKQEEIFEAFVQTERFITRRYGGTGLGLALTAQMVRGMKGDIAVESTLGKGSKFTFNLPLTASRAQPIAMDSGFLSGEKVLVIDDSASSRNVLEKRLQRWDMITAAVTDSEQAMVAVQALCAGAKDLPIIMIDLRLGEENGLELAQRIKNKYGDTSHIIMMLASYADAADMAQCRKAGIDLYLSKPINDGELLEVLQNVMRTTVQLEVERKAILKKTSGPSRHILLAEDSRVNQIVLSRLLEKAGHHITIVGSGGKAVEAVNLTKFDAVFMDVQMPGMDGITATSVIRKEEAITGKHVPIIALTAFATVEDKQRCLDGGMDDYLAKPVTQEQLLTTLENMIQIHNSGDNDSISVMREEPVFDYMRSLNKLAGDPELFQDAAFTFLEHSHILIADLRRYQTQGKLPELAQIAHTLKSSVSHFAADRAYDAALALEKSANAGLLEDSNIACRTLLGELELLQHALRQAGQEKPHN